MRPGQVFERIGGDANVVLATIVGPESRQMNVDRASALAMPLEPFRELEQHDLGALRCIHLVFGERHVICRQSSVCPRAPVWRIGVVDAIRALLRAIVTKSITQPDYGLIKWAPWPGIAVECATAMQ
ncbi:MAG: hypothetical protein V3R75_03920 [Alphaproteobacteria bacterium]